ncbi:MAG: exopolysaccharide biosynthesis polyprenyl glycosylphosphotransferase [Candidatus Omnitrophica bacterium]|nr:exopolysaccharide biosynthesis polyprenyl glycosylphosphotransferase [Candidatus Omnitrophota bacterium]
MERRKFLILFDGAAIYISFLLGYYFRFYTGLFADRGVPSVHFYINITLFAVTAYLLILASLGIYRSRLFPNFVKELAGIIQGTFWTIVILTAGTFFYRGFLYSRLAVGFAMVFSFVFLWICHYAFAKTERAGKKNVLIVGAGPQINSFVKRLMMRSSGSIYPDVLPHFDEDLMKKRISNKKKPAIIAAPGDYGENMRLAKFADEHKLQLYLIPEIYQFLYSGEADDIDGLPFIVTGRIPVEKFPGWLLKKLSDIIVGGLLFLLFCTALPLFCITVAAGSKGPVFFRQKRVGYGGKAFRIFKFRTMKQSCAGEMPYTLPGDKRLTRTGRFLRKYNLDELPQIFNIVNGEMSLAGPRPISVSDRFFMEHDFFSMRLRVKPGLTGWAQVHGLRGGHIEPEERFQYDLYYIENWSIWLDLAIILLSPGALRNAF